MNNISLEVVEAFFDAAIFLLIGISGFLTALLVWTEARWAHLKLDRKSWAIILRSSALAALFTWAFVRSFIGWADSRAILWPLRTFLLFAVVNYLVVLTIQFKQRHELPWRKVFFAPFKRLPTALGIRR